MYGEHLEEMIKLFKENGTPLKATDIAENTIEILHAQGAIDDSMDTDLLAEQLADEARYLDKAVV